MSSLYVPGSQSLHALLASELRGRYLPPWQTAQLGLVSVSRYFPASHVLLHWLMEAMQSRPVDATQIASPHLQSFALGSEPSSIWHGLPAEQLLSEETQYKPVRREQSLSPHLHSTAFAAAPLVIEQSTGGLLLQVLVELTQ